MIATFIYSIIKLVLGVLALVFGLFAGLVLFVVALPTGFCYQLGRLLFYFKKLWKSY
jgi:hypothetical protein